MRLSNQERNIIINALEQRAFDLLCLSARENDAAKLAESNECKRLVRMFDTHTEELRGNGNV